MADDLAAVRGHLTAILELQLEGGLMSVPRDLWTELADLLPARCFAGVARLPTAGRVRRRVEPPPIDQRTAA